ncbi:MAG: VOC family protein [Proteobacteria bacterium]|nr:VOC family protein [Pseudomonadota bacterium]
MSDNTTPQYGEFCWNELMTNYTEKAKSFYTTLFNWKTQSHDMGKMTYTMFMSGEKGIGGMLQTPKDKVGQISPHWMSYISVENVDATLEKAESLGAKVKVPATAAGDFGIFAVIEDPTGAHIAFWQSFSK